MKKLYKLLPHLLFVSLLLLIFTPSLVEIPSKWEFVIVATGIEIVLLIKHKSRPATDIGIIVMAFLNVWEFYTTKVPGVNTMLYPIPQKVFALYVTDFERISMGVFSSLRLLFISFFLALALGIVLGMLVGWFENTRKALFPIAKVLSPIPPIIYSPYAVALLPSFRSASIFVIFSSIFWTVFMNMILSVSSVDKKIMDSARTLNVKTVGMLVHVLLPNSLPMLFNSMTVCVSTSFMVLTAAEMIGATSGLGWYVKYYSDFADYTRVVAGIIVIGVVVTLLNLLIRLLKNAVIKWH